MLALLTNRLTLGAVVIALIVGFYLYTSHRIESLTSELSATQMLSQQQSHDIATLRMRMETLHVATQEFNARATELRNRAQKANQDLKALKLQNMPVDQVEGEVNSRVNDLLRRMGEIGR